jgi:anti-anti-sigma regulatory factor
MITIEKNEQYALISVNSTTIDETISKEIEKKISALYREGYGNFIFDFAKITTIDQEGISLIKKVDKLCQNENGLLVIATENEAIIELLDKSKMPDLVILPTKEEAIEAIYINELENDFREEEDQSDEFGEEEQGNDFE